MFRKWTELPVIHSAAHFHYFVLLDLLCWCALPPERIWEDDCTMGDQVHCLDNCWLSDFRKRKINRYQLQILFHLSRRNTILAANLVRIERLMTSTPWSYQRLLMSLYLSFFLGGGYGISTFVGYSMPNPFLYKWTVLLQTIQSIISTQFSCQNISISRYSV